MVDLKERKQYTLTKDVACDDHAIKTSTFKHKGKFQFYKEIQAGRPFLAGLPLLFIHQGSSQAQETKVSLFCF